MSEQEVKLNFSNYCNLRDLFEDKKSQIIFEKFLRWKICGDMLSLFPLMDGNDPDTFFDSELISKRDDHIFVDVGAYTGDTIMRFLLFCSGHYDRIIGFEPDSGNYAAARAFIRFCRMPNIEIRNCGLWSHRKELTFYTSDNENKRLYDSPNFFRSIKHSRDKIIRW